MNNGDLLGTLWVFTTSAEAQVPDMFLPVAVFDTLQRGTQWAADKAASGTLTEYPINVSAYDWAIANGYFKPRRADQRAAHFIETFSDASQAHCHFEKGVAETRCQPRGIPAETPHAWVFNGRGRRGHLPSAVFTEHTLAEAWIAGVRAAGILSHLSVNLEPSAVDTAVEKYTDGRLDKLGTGS